MSICLYVCVNCVCCLYRAMNSEHCILLTVMNWYRHLAFLVSVPTPFTVLIIVETTTILVTPQWILGRNRTWRLVHFRLQVAKQFFLPMTVHSSLYLFSFYHMSLHRCMQNFVFTTNLTTVRLFAPKLCPAFSQWPVDHAFKTVLYLNHY
jgi:hypothetical protein